MVFYAHCPESLLNAKMGQIPLQININAFFYAAALATRQQNTMDLNTELVAF